MRLYEPLMTFAELKMGIDARECHAVFLDTENGPKDFSNWVQPPVPVIGIGGGNQEFLPILDTFLEAGFSAENLKGSIVEQYAAAAILIQLLRVLPSLNLQQGLAMESLAYATLQAGAGHKEWVAGLAAELQTGRRNQSGASVAGVVQLSRDGDEVIAVLDRPQAGNAIDRAMRDGLHEAFTLVNMDPSISRITLKAVGKTFSLGADLTEFGTTTDPVAAHQIRTLTLPAHEAAKCADRFWVEIDGACVGSGLELAAFASRITATRRSWFQLPELAMGIIPGAGGCVSLTRRIGRHRTALMILSGKRISATKALEWGLIDALID